MDPLFTEIGIIIIAATGCALLARLLKQPPLIGYILAGLILGPLGGKFIQNHDLFEALRQLGVAVMLFLVGLELDWNKARHQLGTTLVVGLFQIGGSFALGFFIAIALGLPLITSLYLGAILAFSSTVIVVKLLSESRDLASLYGRLSVGILLVQDLAAIIALILLGSLGGAPSSLPVSLAIALLLVRIAALLALLWVCTQYILPYLFGRIARSSELLFLSSLAWCFLVAVAASYYGFPIEIGAFLAGVSLAPLPYTLDILSRLRSLRDFSVIFFFVGIGTSLELPSLPYLALTGVLTAATLIFKPALVLSSLTQRGYKARTAFLTALTQGQLSELSLILVSIGLSRGQLSPQLGSSLVFTAVISLLISTVLITNREWLYRVLRKPLRTLEQPGRALPVEVEERLQDHIIIFGYHRMGYHILKKLRELHHRVLVIDFNPDIIKRLQEQAVDCLYGDIQDEDILEQIHVARASMVISTVPHREETLFLIKQVKAAHSQALLIVTTHTVDDALLFYKKGADYVILPHLLGGEHVADLITQYEHHSLVRFIRHRAEEVKLLRTKNHALYYD